MDAGRRSEAGGHALALARVRLAEHRGGLEGRVGDLGDGELLVVGLLGRDDGRARRDDEVGARIRRQAGMELSHIDAERAVRAGRRSQRHDDQRNQAVEVGVRRVFDVEVATAVVVVRFVVNPEGRI
eukprot:4718403-Pleurochrysis_carterae.AAC.4